MPTREKKSEGFDARLHFSYSVGCNQASRYLEKLESMGVIIEITGKARNRLYRADRVMKIIKE